MYRLNQVKLNINHSEDDLRKKTAGILKVKYEDIDQSSFIILHKSIDARDKNNICFVYNVAFEFNEERINAKNNSYLKNAISKLKVYNENVFNPIVAEDIKSDDLRNKRPVVVGFGPAGIFAAYVLALNGLRPIVVERGKAIDDRIKDTEKFFETLELDENSNVCFGEGGAGAFSDGKLNTNNKDKDGIYQFVLKTFVKFGADKNILYENMPHIGTDKLIQVIKNIKAEIIRLGGEIHYNTKWYYDKKNSRSLFIDIEKLKKLKDDEKLDYSKCLNENILIDDDAKIILAIGNSSRDTFRNMIDGGFDLKPKTIAVGYRIAHKQDFINHSQYGNEKNLPPAVYKLVCEVDGRSVYSFCMCPGGYIINSSNYKNKLSINGMSYNDRAGKYANSAVVVTVKPEDIECKNKSSNTIEGEMMINFQELVEKKAYELENGYIPYMSSEEINTIDVFKGKARLNNKLKSVYDDVGLKFDINECIEKGLCQFDNKIKGFLDSKILAGVETRTSSPVMLERDENYMCNIKNYYPSGEGLGHGGGIMSSAVDGIKVAFKISTK